MPKVMTQAPSVAPATTPAAVGDALSRGSTSLADPLTAPTGGGIVGDVSEQDLATPLRLPDTMGSNAVMDVSSAKVHNTKKPIDVRKLAVTSGTSIKIVAPDSGGKTSVKLFKWSEEHAGYIVYEGSVSSSAVAIGGTRQTGLDDEAQVLPASAGGIKQEDVYQNGVSDCYFQASVVAIANSQPDAIMNAITDHPDAGKVSVKLYDNRSQRKTYVLERSLFLDDEGNPTYGGKKGTYLWPAFLGKALALHKGSYQDAAMGVAYSAMEMITGKSTSAKPINADALKKDPSNAFANYEFYRDRIASNQPLVLQTSSFAKKGVMAKLKNSFKTKKGMASNQPAGKVRGLHSYAVTGMDKMGLTEEAFDGKWPSVKLTLRDPRDPAGETFQRTLKDVLTSGKFTSQHGVIS